MARAVLGWGIRDLARHSGVTANTVTRYENGGNATIDTLEKLKRALLDAGITFVPENGGPATIRPPRR
jgi:transcriptional regulator with XRE-family HTH domain